MKIARLTIVQASAKDQRIEGRDWPLGAETMIGLERLSNIESCVTEVLRSAIPGDLIEAGVWRGGATIFMRGVLKAYRDTTRSVWVADSFQGLPRPDPEEYAADFRDPHHAATSLAVSLEEPIDKLAILRLDGDMYESTMVALRYLYPKLSLGGFAIVDDYGNDRLSCKKAVDDFRALHGITEEIERIDWTGIFWRRLR
jgi:O-methyltransferase